MGEEKSLFEKKSQIPGKLLIPDKYSWGVSYEYLPGWPEQTEEEIIGLCLRNQHMGEDKSLFEKKSQIPGRFPHPDKYSWVIS